MTLEKRGVDLERGTLKIFKGKSKAARRTLKLTVAAREIVARRMWESTLALDVPDAQDQDTRRSAHLAAKWPFR